MIHLSRIVLLGSWLATAVSAAVFQGNGLKIGEVTTDSAVIWTRLTVAAEANWSGTPWLAPSLGPNQTPAVRAEGAGKKKADGEAALRDIASRADWRSQIPMGRTLAEMHGTLPGAAGSVRVTLTPVPGGPPTVTAWLAVDPTRDHTRQFKIDSLRAGTAYRVVAESRDAQGASGPTIEGSFRTAPVAAAATPVTFAVVTCGDYPRRDDPANGHRIYDTLRRLALDFAVHTGDVEYYDKADPWATSAELARVKWNRLFALPFQRAFHNRTPVYFTNDDHDILKNDAWPGQTYGSLTWDEGLAIFAEQTPSSPLPYRSFRHGRDLEIWVIEGRRFRTPNNTPDGPAKTILGAEQKAWLFRTIAASTATFKVLVSPTPIVGPDRGNKNDNHANAGFKHEGDELRRFLGAQKNLIVTCGDRHWQYCSIDPMSGTREFGCGPMSDVHAGGYSPQPGDEAIQKFFRLKGGFLTVATKPAGATATLEIRHHAVDGTVTHTATLKPDGTLERKLPR
ncbi:MAG: alkaline phosphatase D family protein [Opitutaceae bacterium]|nr:alkaline phosphatase D family protein [Opitutaceae bacterium]